MTGKNPPAPARRRRIRPAVVLHGSALVVTTVMLVVAEAKLPPYQGD